MLSAYVVRTSTPPSPEDRDFHPAGSLEVGGGSSGASQYPKGFAWWLPTVAGASALGCQESGRPLGC